MMRHCCASLRLSMGVPPVTRVPRPRSRVTTIGRRARRPPSEDGFSRHTSREVGRASGRAHGSTDALRIDSTTQGEVSGRARCRRDQGSAAASAASWESAGLDGAVVVSLQLSRPPPSRPNGDSRHSRHSSVHTSRQSRRLGPAESTQRHRAVESPQSRLRHEKPSRW